METRKDGRSALELVEFDKDDSRADELSMTVTNRGEAGIGEILARQAMAWCRGWLRTLPVRMTLNNIGLLTILLAILSPRTLIYRLVYPIFRLVFGTLYPAYASYKAVRTKNVKEYVKWMMYWIVFALFTCAETFTDVFFSFWFPFYYEIKIILVLWLLSPATKGSSILYRRFVHPALIRREAEIDEALARATEQGYTAVLHLGTKGVNYATTVLMQTAIKGGGGLVQQLRKSYSLSDLTGEKEDENRNTPDARDETDTEAEPRRREHAGRRGYSPRRTQSSSNAPRVDMYFSEVDVDVRQQRPRESVASLTNLRSSDDISSGYSSGEALQSQRVVSQGDSLVRTSSVGARTRAKPRSTTKKTPEDRSEDFDRIEPPFPENLSLPSSLNVLTPEQALELLLLFSRGSQPRNCPTTTESVVENQTATRLEDDESLSTESSEFMESDSTRVDAQTVQTIEIKHIVTENLLVPTVAKSADKANMEKVTDFRQTNMQFAYIDDEAKDDPTVSPALEMPDIDTNLESRMTDEICQEKIDELKQLLDDAHRAVANIVSSQDKLNAIDKGEEYDASVPETRDLPSVDTRDYSIAVERSAVPSPSNCILDDDNRAGKYHKKPAPRVPPSNEATQVNDADDIDESSQNALKATLVIKTGTLRTVSNPDVTKDIFLAGTPDSTKRKKKSSKLRAKKGLTKLLTIPKNIFHNAFHKEQSEDSSKEEDSSSTLSGTSESASRSGSIGSQVFVDGPAKLSASKQQVDAEEIPLRLEREDARNLGKDIDEKLVTRNKDETNLENDKKKDVARNTKNSETCVEKDVGNKFNFETRAGKKEIITDIN